MTTPPKAKKISRETTMHGYTLRDDYYWIRERENKDVLDLLAKENAYAEAVTAKEAPLRDNLYAEFVERIKEDDMSAPEKVDDYYYYSRTEKGKQYPLYCRKNGAMDAEEELVFDANEEAKNETFFRIEAYTVSPDHSLLAYAVDTKGDERGTLRVKEIATGAVFPFVIENVDDVEWANDNRTILYTTLDSANRADKLFRRDIHSDPKKDECIFHEQDEAYRLSIGKTRDAEYFILTIGSNVSSEARYMNAENAYGALRLMQEREKGVEYYPSHSGDMFYILTNKNAENFKVVAAPDNAPHSGNWTDLVPPRENARLENLSCFKDHVVIFEQSDGLPKILIYTLSTNERHYVSFEEEAYALSRASNRVFDKQTLRFSYSSLVTPFTTYEYDMNARTFSVLKEQTVNGYKKNNYETKRIFAPSHDGAMVPITLAYRKDLFKNDGSNPMRLSGYGAYGIIYEPSFESTAVSLLDRGVVVAIAHVRGGEEMGRRWYLNGKRLHKKNTFLDFIACMQFLIAERYTSAKRLVISGGSAGGLLMGAVMNMAGGLCKACVARVPFVDALNTMLDDALPLTIIEYDEWGNPNEKDYFEYLYSYSPYENITRMGYPNVLFTTGINDMRVSYWEPVKWAQKAREYNNAQTTIAVKIDMQSGHGGVSGRYAALKETAFAYAYTIAIVE